jgi:hypothetical protein
LGNPHLDAAPYISEFMAANSTTLADADGDYSDWIEIHNPDAAPISLQGWFLTDTTNNLAKWAFPGMILPADGYLVVFASGKDLRNPSGELHANFRLANTGEYLALVRPDGASVASEFAPSYPPQLTDISYGMTVRAGGEQVLVPTNTTAQILIPAEPVSSDWTAPEFIPGSNWITGRTGIGFEKSSGPSSGRVLVIVNSAVTAPALAGDQALVSRLRDVLGHTVTVIEDLAAQTSDAEDKDLVIVSSSVLSGNVNVKFRDVSLPVINLESGLADDFLLSASGANVVNQTAITITADGAAHPLGAGLGAGPWIVRSPAATFHTASNNQLASGAQVIAIAANSAPAILVLEPAAPMNNGAPAPGLRIHLPFGDESANGLNASGLALLDAAVAYALQDVVTRPNFTGLIATDLGLLMHGNNSTALVRLTFEPGEQTGYEALLLRMKYNDGFAAYLNGTEIARRNSPGMLEWNSAAAAVRPSWQGTVFEEIDLSESLGTLRSGLNVLAIHGLNAKPGNDDFLILPELSAGTAFTRGSEYFTTPTPGGPNVPGVLGIVPEVTFTPERGFYDAPFSLTLSNDLQGTEIRFTTNGTPPGATSGFVYTGPIIVSRTMVIRAAAFRPGYETPGAVTHSYFFLDGIIRQARDIPGWPRPVMSVGQGTRQHDYEMDPRITQAAPYTNELRAGLLEIPTLSIVVHQPEMWDAAGNGGFYRGDDVQKPVSVELIYPEAREKNVFATAAIQGHSHDRLKRSFRLSFKTGFGPTKFVSTLFQDAPVNGGSATRTADHVVLRGGNNRCWARSWNPDRTAYIEDQWFRDTQVAMSGIGSRGNFVHLYINGIYWGLYNPVERPDASFAAEYLGGNKEDWFSVSHGGEHGGNPARWNYLRGGLTDKNMTLPANYDELAGYLAVTNFVDYLLLSWHIGMTDWPQNNWWGANRNDPPGPFHFFAWDGEWSWGVGSSPAGAWVHPDFRASGGNTSRPISKIWHAARRNNDFMMLVADRLFQHTSDQGALSDASSLERWMTWSNYLRRPVVAESARWGDTMDAALPRTRDVHWQNEIERIRQMMTGNGARLVAALRAEGFYPNINPPEFSPPAGTVDAGSAISLANPNVSGTVYYTWDGSDPRLPGGSVNPDALPGANPAAIVTSRQLRARVLSGTTWSALNEATYLVTGGAPIRITELMYHPAASSPEEFAAGFTNANDFEFVELFNTGTAPVPLDGFEFDRGISFVFSNHTLGAGEYALIVRNRAAFEFRNGVELPVLGKYEGLLDNAGERLRLRDAFGQTILDFTYDDAWYPETDGGGYSLVIRDPSGSAEAWGLKESWRASSHPGGSPGAPDPGIANTFENWRHRYFTHIELADPSVSGPNADPDEDGLPNVLEYAFGLNPRVADPLPLLAPLAEGNALSFVYTRPREAGDLTYEVLAAADLNGPWSAVPVEQEILTFDDWTETVQVRGSFPSSIQGFLWLTIRFEGGAAPQSGQQKLKAEN